MDDREERRAFGGEGDGGNPVRVKDDDGGPVQEITEGLGPGGVENQSALEYLWDC